MEIIFYRYGSICEPDLIDALSLCGISVIEENTEMYQKSINFESRIRILGELILSHHPAFVFSVNYFPHISEICEKTNTLYVALSVDCPVLELFHVSIRNQCNRIFLFDYEQYERFYPQNPKCIFYLPLATNIGRWEQLLSSLTDSDYQKYSCDLSFVGSLYTEKSPLDRLTLSNSLRGYIDGLTDAELCMPGCHLFEEILSSDIVNALKDAAPSFPYMDNSFSNK